MTTPPPPFDPPSPPFAPEVGDELRRVRDEKEALIERQQFEEAAAVRERERRLTRAARTFAAAWEARQEDPPAPMTGEFTETIEFEPSRGRMRRGVVDYAPARRFPTGLLLGWLLFAVAFGLGILIGLVLNA